MAIQMSRAQSNHKRNNSKEIKPKSEHPSPDLKELGKNVLRKLIPSQSIIMLKKLVQGADTLRREILPAPKLLPVLTIKNMQNELADRNPSTHSNFQQMNKELTHSMLFFHQKVNVPAENAELMRLQTEKCYRKIPQSYFENQMRADVVGRLLTRERDRVRDLRDELGDYLDEVEFNVNQQVAYKMKVFMTFVNYLTNIGVLADLSITKIRGTRLKNKVIQEIVVQRAGRVNALRYRKEMIEKYLQTLHALKKLKKLQNHLICQVQAKGKILISDYYAEYCLIHENIKQYCCPRMLCKYWDVAYYVERGYQDSFSRSLKNYLGQIIVVDEKQLKEVVQPSKVQFATVVLRPEHSLDESYEVDDDDVELVTKHNIERQIASIFQLGINKCTYATDDICEQLKTSLQQCENKFYGLIKGDQPLLVPRPLNKTEKKTALDRLSINKYVKVVQLWSGRLKKIVKRQASVIEKILKVAEELREESPDKEEVVCSYLIQILQITLLCVDESLATMISGRKLSQRESEPIRQILHQCKEWKNLIIELRHSPAIWQQFTARFAHSQERKDVELNIVEGLLAQLSSLRRRNVQTMIDVYNATSIEQLPLKLQEEEWKAISIPSGFQRTLGEVIYGSLYVQYMENSDRKLLSTSLLLDRSMILDKSTLKDLELSRMQEDKRSGSGSRLKMEFNLQMNGNEVTMEFESFRLVSSTLTVVEFLHGYLQWVEEADGVGQQLQSTILSKIMEFLIMYNTHVKDLILNKEALKYGKVKTKSITGKHLLIAYSQLMFFRSLTQLIANRFQTFSQFAALIRARIQKNIADISKKFREVLQLAIRQSIEKLVVDPRKQIKGPVPSSMQIVNVLTKSREYVRDILCGDKLMNQFLNVAWCNLYLDKIKVQHKSVTRMIMSSTGSRKSKDIDWTDNLYWKFKELEYLSQNLAEMREHIPGFENILSELQEERKKLEHPQ